MSDKPLNLLALASLIFELSREAGRVALRCRNEALEISSKQDGSPMTKADQMVEAFICSALKKMTPDIPIIAEEQVRDPYDEKVLLPFAREVGTPEVLRKLLALTAADIAAVGPDVLTKWKESILVELYLRAMQEVSGERETADEPQRLARIADDVVAPSHGVQDLPNDKAWIRSELEQFPLRYAYGTSRRRIAAHLSAIRRLQPGGVVVETDFNAPLGTCEYAVIAPTGLTPGLFSKIAGVMAAGSVGHAARQRSFHPQQRLNHETEQVHRPGLRGRHLRHVGLHGGPQPLPRPWALAAARLH